MWGLGCKDDKKLRHEAGEKYLDKGLVELKNESWEKRANTWEKRNLWFQCGTDIVKKIVWMVISCIANLWCLLGAFPHKYSPEKQIAPFMSMLIKLKIQLKFEF